MCIFHIEDILIPDISHTGYISYCKAPSESLAERPKVTQQHYVAVSNIPRRIADKYATYNHGTTYPPPKTPLRHHLSHGSRTRTNIGIKDSGNQKVQEICALNYHID